MLHGRLRQRVLLMLEKLDTLSRIKYYLGPWSATILYYNNCIFSAICIWYSCPNLAEISGSWQQHPWTMRIRAPIFLPLEYTAHQSYARYFEQWERGLLRARTQSNLFCGRTLGKKPPNARTCTQQLLQLGDKNRERVNSVAPANQPFSCLGLATVCMFLN